MDATPITRMAHTVQDAAQSAGPAREEISRAATILLTDPLPLWLFPTLFLGGLLLQAAALFLHRRLWLTAGVGLVLAAAAVDSDLTLATGQALAFIGLCGCARQKS
ncbi:hypothetical protein [uncultured Desulfovibrio sp.]|uniref:hypothetical protein n=1 Tax=uncultured Desulfovibrio sp. TaxID=167968 RepID=UPI0026235D3C|nr:hypothetical protein [uncultured Desulfovibrio sp.]